MTDPAQLIGPAGLLEVFLGPGDLYFGDRHTRIRTLLGSCVAITLWHPVALIGGMCHYMMPTRDGPSARAPSAEPAPSTAPSSGALPDDHRPRRAPHHDFCGKYADEALMILLDEIQAARTSPLDYQVKMFGGGTQFPGHQSASAVDVAARNIEAGLHLLAERGLSPPTSMHLGGTGHRQVVLDVWNGNVWVRHRQLVEERALP
jgi:chemotaxis protein CheD